MSTLKSTGPKALAILIVYFTLGIATRVIAVMVFIVPVLHGDVETAKTAVENYSFLGALMVLHILASFLVLTWFYRGAEGKRRRFLQSFWTLIVPPVFIDWETLHRLMRYEMPIEECWKRSRKLFLSHNLLMVTENLAMCLASLLRSKWKWDVVRFATMMIFPLIQFSMVALAYLYFRQAHLWSRIIRRYPSRWLTRSPIAPKETNAQNDLALDNLQRPLAEEEV